MIREVRREEIPECVRVIRKSHQTVADEFGFTEENAPRYVAFATDENRLRWHMDSEHRLMFLYEEGGVIKGYYSLLPKDDNDCELSNLSVLPEYRHQGIGTELLRHAVSTAREHHCGILRLSIVEENTVLRKWYERNGAIHTGKEKYDFFPFTCGYMMIRLQPPANDQAGIQNILSGEERRNIVMDKKTLMENLARESFEKGGFNGAWLYAENGEIVSKGAVGFRDPANNFPITEDTIFQLASVSKQFTASAVMLLVRQGLLRLEDEITKYFPEIPYPGVTVRHLLTHTGGVPDYFDDADWFIRIWKEEKRVPGNDEILRFLCETKLKAYFAPGEKIEYSNTGYNLLALLVERLSGIPYEDFLQKNIFEPAGMTSTRCCHIRRDGVPFEKYAQASVFVIDRYIADMDSAKISEVAAFDGLNGDDYVYTNIFDMLRWDKALREGKVLTPEEQQLMYTPARLNSGEDAVFDEDDGLGYGFGWGVGRDEKYGLIVSHSGGMPGVITWFERFIDADRVLVMLSNRDPEEYRAFAGFYNGMQKIARDQEAEPIRTIGDLALKDPDRSKWESFCGKYEHPEDEEFVIDKVYMKDGELYADAVSEEYGEFSFRLYPIGENEFGRKSGMLKLTFGDGCIMYDEFTCKKL